MLRKIVKLLKKPRILLLHILKLKMCRVFPDHLYLKVKYQLTIRRKLNLNYPSTFNEKLQWLKLYDRKPMYTQLVDKYEVREYVKKTIGDEYLIPLLGVYDNFDDIDFQKLPNQFVLKCTHDSGGVVICKNKNDFDQESARKKINKCLKHNYFYLGREWPYKDIRPRIICEKYMEDESSKELRDYKYMCFNGKVKCSFVVLNRNSTTGINVDFYDLDWKLMPFERHYPNSGINISKPQNYQKMIEFAERLSKDIPFLRVDFYEVNGQLYFGELTFYPGSGFEEFTPESYDELLGRWIELPNKNLKVGGLSD